MSAHEVGTGARRSGARPFRWPRWPDGRARLGYGADYNPEQWPREVWADDVRLMREAGVNVVSLAIFSWAHLQPAPGEWDFAWLDDVVGLLTEHDVAVDLATATASPPPWLTTAHPEVLPVDAEGRTLHPGGRQHWRPTSPVFREHALALVEQLATRYGSHPGVVAWHVNNELGCHNTYDHSADATAAFRRWLRERYGDVRALNDAWGTAFWSQRYSDFEEVLTPRLAASFVNPGQQLDFRRFSSDALKEHLRAERAVLDRLSPQVPVTTNFMVMGHQDIVDYADWAPEVDFVANDHYVVPSPQARDELSFSANLTRGVAGGRPWFLMEHSTSAVNWQPVNPAKPAGALERDSLTHLAHGADAVCFFQWRQSAAGAEKWHSAMVPHAGEDSDVFRSVVRLGGRLRELDDLAGSTVVPARVALLFDWASWWAVEAEVHPTERLRYRGEALDWYAAALDLGVRVDVVPAGADWSAYDVVVAPVLHVVPSELAERLRRHAEGGGHLVTTYASGVVDEHDRVLLGGYPGALRDVLGVRVQEVSPLLEGEAAGVQGEGWSAAASVWTEQVDAAEDTVVLARFTSGPQEGRPAITSRALEGGRATYVAADLGQAGLRHVLQEVLATSGAAQELDDGTGRHVELVVRRGSVTEWLFVINRTDREVPGEVVRRAVVRHRGAGGGTTAVEVQALAPRGVLVLEQPRGA